MSSFVSVSTSRLRPGLRVEGDVILKIRVGIALCVLLLAASACGGSDDGAAPTTAAAAPTTIVPIPVEDPLEGRGTRPGSPLGDLPPHITRIELPPELAKPSRLSWSP